MALFLALVLAALAGLVSWAVDRAQVPGKVKVFFSVVFIVACVLFAVLFFEWLGVLIRPFPRLT